MPFCNLCASKDGTFERENCVPKRAALFRASISRPRYLRLRKQLLASLLTAREVYTGKADEFDDKMNNETQELGADRARARDFQRTKRTKNPGREGPGFEINGG